MNQWDIETVIHDNKDVIYYFKHLDIDNKKKFDEISQIIQKMILDIMDHNNNLFKFLEAWTDTTKLGWKKRKNNSLIEKTIKNPKYYMISPKYIIDLCIQSYDKERNNLIVIDALESILDLYEKEYNLL